MAALPQQALTFNDVFDDDSDEPQQPQQTVQHIRANSSIMQLKKILGEPFGHLCSFAHIFNGWANVPRGILY